MGNAGRNGGEYYTPRPLIRAIDQSRQTPTSAKPSTTAPAAPPASSANPTITCAPTPQTSPPADKTLQKKTFYGKEKKSLAYVIGIMNMILHGIEAPNIIHTNTLSENLADIQEKDRFDIILANPPFGGKERAEIQQNFPIKTGETAFLFLQHFIKMLRPAAAAASSSKTPSSPIPTTPRSPCANFSSNPATSTPSSTAPAAPSRAPASKPSCSSSKKAPTPRKIWYYQLDPGRNLGKTNPLNDEDLAEFVKLQKTHADSPKILELDVKSSHDFHL